MLQQTAALIGMVVDRKEDVMLRRPPCGVLVGCYPARDDTRQRIQLNLQTQNYEQLLLNVMELGFPSPIKEMTCIASMLDRIDAAYALPFPAKQELA